MAITRSESYSIIPIDLGLSLSTDGDWEEARIILKTGGWSEIRDQLAGRANYAGAGVRCFQQASRQLLIGQHGFAAFVLPWQVEYFSDSRPFRPEVHLWHRRFIHRALQDGDSPLLTEIDLQLVRSLRTQLRRHQSRLNRRYSHDKIVHYAMTTHFFHDDTLGGKYELDPTSETALSLCLDPSSINLEDSEFLLKPNRDQVQLPREVRLPEHAQTIALTPACVSYASWSSVIVHGIVTEAERSLVLGLQIRTQLAWLAAWVSQDFANNLLNTKHADVSPRRVAWQQAEMNRLKKLASSRTTSSESIRIKALRRSFEHTSGLNEEWELAQSTMESASEYAALVTSDLNHKRVTILEILLLALSVISLAQMVIPTPILSLADIAEYRIQVITVLAVVITGSWLILSRQR